MLRCVLQKQHGTNIYDISVSAIKAAGGDTPKYVCDRHNTLLLYDIKYMCYDIYSHNTE